MEGVFEKLNLVYPLLLFDSNCICFKNKCILIKWNYCKNSFVNYIKSIFSIYNVYYVNKKIFKRVRKKNVITRQFLSKSTRKPWNQKGLGRARSGSFKSPLWRGGSTLFGSKSVRLLFSLNKKNKRLTFFYLLLNKRTFISFCFLSFLLHRFNTIFHFTVKEQRVSGIVSKNICYIMMHDSMNIKNNGFKFMLDLNLLFILKFDYIIFLL